MSAAGGRDPSHPARTLAIDASTSVGTAAVFVGGELAAAGRAEMVAAGGDAAPRRHDAGLVATVARLLEECGLRPAELQRIVCGAGPGSFTGLRVAASTAKGIATALGIPLVAVPSLALLAPDAAELPAGRYLATMDAMRGERYASLLTVGGEGELLAVGPVELHPAGAIQARARELAASVIGEGGEPAARPHARRALRALAARGVEAGPVPLDGWEPSYGRVAEAQARWEAAHGRPLPRG